MDTFFTFLYAVAGILIGGLATHFLSKDISRQNDFKNAAATFRSKVYAELSGLYPYPIKWPEEMIHSINRIPAFLESKFVILNAAVADFRDSLPSEEWDAFDKAWIAYYNANGDSRCQCYHHYMPFNSNPNYKDNFKHNVDNLLKYAKQKKHTTFQSSRSLRSG
jgi:hypothetical protein